MKTTWAQTVFNSEVEDEWWGFEDDEPEGGSPRFRRNRKKTNIVCDRCGEGGLRWEEDDDGFRLVKKDGSLHSCTDMDGLLERM